jgi:hypothetical protein
MDFTSENFNALPKEKQKLFLRTHFLIEEIKKVFSEDEDCRVAAAALMNALSIVLMAFPDPLAMAREAGDGLVGIMKDRLKKETQHDERHEQTPMVPMVPKSERTVLTLKLDEDDDMRCYIWQVGDFTHEHYGLAICDVVRHVAIAYGVSEDAVWKWVDMERHQPTTKLTCLHKGLVKPS